MEIDDLTITRGNGLLRGGGIWNDGTLTLSNAVVSDNVVVGLPGVGPTVAAFGGGIYNPGTLTVLHTTFARNRAAGAAGNPGGPGSGGLGGAIVSISDSAARRPRPPSATARSSTTGPSAGRPGPAAPPAAGIGGAILNDNSSMTVSHSLFRDNRAVGGSGRLLRRVRVRRGHPERRPVRRHHPLGQPQHAGGQPGRRRGRRRPAAVGRGGGDRELRGLGAPPGSTFSAATTVAHSTLAGNRAVGGAGPTGGTGQGGGIANENGGDLTVTDSRSS